MALSFNAKAEIAETNGTPSASFSCGADVKLLVLHIANDTNTTRQGGAPTYDDVALTEVTPQVDFGEGTAEVWYMINPPVSQSLTISVPNTGGANTSVYISDYDAASGYTAAFDKFAQNQQISANPNVSVTPTNADSLIVDAMFSGDGTTPTGNSDNLLYQYDTGQEGNGCQYKVNAAVEVNTLTWTIPSDDWNMVVAVFYEVAGGTDYNEYPADTHSITDAGLKLDIEINLSETLAIADEIKNSPEINLSDSISISDSISLGIENILADLVSISDALSNEPDIGLAENLSINDALSLAIEVFLSDIQALADVYSDDWAGGTDYFLYPTDSMSIADALSNEPNLGLTETLSITDNLSIDVAVFLSELLSVADDIKNSLGLGLSDSIAIVDNFLKKSAFFRSLVDTHSISDAISLSSEISLSDSIPIADSLANLIGMFLSDDVLLSDLISLSPEISLIDVLVITDTYVDDQIAGILFTIIKKAKKLIEAKSAVNKLINVENKTIKYITVTQRTHKED